MSAPTFYKQIARLAIVTPEFSTYYMPHTTHIGGDRLIKISEEEDAFLLLNNEGAIIGEVKKSVPHIVDYYREKESGAPTEKIGKPEKWD